MVASGYASRFIDASRLVVVGIASLVIGTYPLFHVLREGGFVTVVAAQAAFAIMTGCMGGVIFVVLPDLLKRNWGNFGMAVTYSFATALFGGTAPVVCAYLIQVTGPSERAGDLHLGKRFAGSAGGLPCLPRASSPNA